MDRGMKHFIVLLLAVLAEGWAFYVVSYVDGPFTQTLAFGFFASLTVLVTFIGGFYYLTEEDDKRTAGAFAAGLVILQGWGIYCTGYFGSGVFSHPAFIGLLVLGLLGTLLMALSYLEMRHPRVTVEFKQQIVLFLVVWVECLGFFLAYYFDGPFCRTEGFFGCVGFTIVITLCAGVLIIEDGIWEREEKRRKAKQQRKAERGR